MGRKKGHGGDVNKIGTIIRRMGHLGWGVLTVHTQGGWITRAKRSSQTRNVQVESRNKSLVDALQGLERGCKEEWASVMEKEKQEAADSLSTNSIAGNGISSEQQTNGSRESSSGSDTEISNAQGVA